jgi:hypothetical protein
MNNYKLENLIKIIGLDKALEMCNLIEAKRLGYFVPEKEPVLQSPDCEPNVDSLFITGSFLHRQDESVVLPFQTYHFLKDDCPACFRPAHPVTLKEEN